MNYHIQIRHNDKKIFFKQDCKGPHTTIGELHSAYDPIMSGYDFEVINGTIVVGTTKNGTDFKKIKDKWKNGSASNKEMQDVLKHLIG